MFYTTLNQLAFVVLLPLGIVALLALLIASLSFTYIETKEYG